MDQESFQRHIHAIASAPDVALLAGKFHAHLTVHAAPDQFDALRAKCRELKSKLTVVDLEDLSGHSQTDVMATCYFFDPEQGAVGRISSQLIAKIRVLHEAGWCVVRTKLEHESLPSLSVFDQSHYHEIHVKLRLLARSFERDHERLRVMGKELGFVPSRNPFDRDDVCVTQFVNRRIYSGTQDDADRDVDGMLIALNQSGFEILEVKRETVVYDTDQQLDSWWIQQ